MRQKICFAFVLLAFIGWMSYSDLVSFAQSGPSASISKGPPLSADQKSFFESKIRPVLVKNCYQCHAADAKVVEGGLQLDTRQNLLQGGIDGAVIVPGNPDKSLLIKAIRYQDKDLEMPPRDNGGKLSDSIIQDFVTWVKMGAPDPRDGASAGPATKPYDTTEARKWWSFQPLKRQEVPTVQDSSWPRNDVDRFVLAAQEAKSLKPVADADKQTLIRRVYFDLIGLPPTPEQVDAFVQDSSPDAYEKTVDALLASPRYGEHWGRHWLDVARYAESSGKDDNVTFPDAWRFRDYVIVSFNQDKPYNQFIKEQLAGDLLSAPNPKKRAEQLIATSFLAVGPKGLDENVPRQFDLDLADEQVDATSQAFMALTVSCARCHDHKFDPIMQKDYYSMAGIFLSTKTYYGTVEGLRNNEPSELIELPKEANSPSAQKDLTPEQQKDLQQQLSTATTEYEDLLAERPGRRGARQGAAAAQGNNANNANLVQLNAQIRQALAKKAQLENQLNGYDELGHPKTFSMGVMDRPTPIGPVPPMLATSGAQAKPALLRRQSSGFETIADSPLFFRGDQSEPRDRVPRGFPAFLVTGKQQTIPRNQSGRLELANWIASPKNPLTARVMANRIWCWLYGQGIVASVDNFGTMGEAPANQALLDYLANRLIENGWSIKKTIREIVLSRSYQLGSTYDETDFSGDSQNTLVWRHSKRRLNAECIRDAMLQSSGDLSFDPPVGSAVANAGDGIIGAGPVFARINEDSLINAGGNFRSVYLPVARDVVPDSLAVLDYPDTTVVHGERETTNVPSQALYLLNSEFVHQEAKQLAARLTTAFPDQNSPTMRQDRVNLAFRLVFGRAPSQDEQNAAGLFFSHMSSEPRIFAAGSWIDFCLALYNTAEFRYVN